MPENPQNERYNGINGLRAFAAVAIVLMHVRSNLGYAPESFVFEKLIPSFSDYVFLFMMVSSFSMCCGFFEKVSNGQITPNQFYSKRFSKIWPFFALLSAVDLIVSPNLESVYEVFANLTLCFGLLPNARITVIGVGWTLGVVFVFYLLFPFFCFLLSSKKRAWFVLLVACVLHYLCKVYFFDSDHVIQGFSGRTNILYCAIYFLAGGLIYLYRYPLTRIACHFRWLLWAVTVAAAIALSWFRGSTAVLLAVFSLMLICAISCNADRSLLNNRVSRFLSGISMEIYLCHMAVYRVVEKLNVAALFRSQLLAYCVVAALTIVGAIVFSVAAKWCIAKLKQVLLTLTTEKSKA